MYSDRVGWHFILALMGACGFVPGTLPAIDGREPDVSDVLVPTWTIDETSRIAVPGSAAEWDDLARAYVLTSGAPDHLWQMQESQGSLGDTIGSVSLNPVNIPTYRDMVAGWARAAVGTIDTSGNMGFRSTAIGNLDGNSYLLLVYVAVLSTPTAERSIAGIGAETDHRYVAVIPGSSFRATGPGIVPLDGIPGAAVGAHPIVLKVDARAATFAVYTEAEKLTPAWVAPAGRGNLLMIGNAVIGAASARYLYASLWTGPHAEASDSDVKRLLEALGWTVTGY
jgi:hypothetical protein